MDGQLSSPPQILPKLEIDELRRDTGGAVDTAQTWEGIEGTAEIRTAVPGALLRYYQAFPRYAEPQDQMLTYATDPIVAPVLKDVVNAIQATLEQPAPGTLARQIISYVQGTTYRTGEPRQKTPIETLVDGCGDCSDQSVLLASLLHLVDHPSILLYFPPRGGQPGHAAVGVAGLDGADGGAQLTVEGRDYLYVETTQQMRIGETGDLSKSAARLLPLEPKPVLVATWSAQSRGGDAELQVRVSNIGSGPARNTKVWTGLVAGPQKAWDQDTESLGTLKPHREEVVFFDLDAPRDLDELVVDVKAWAENAELHRSSS